MCSRADPPSVPLMPYNQACFSFRHIGDVSKHALQARSCGVQEPCVVRPSHMRHYSRLHGARTVPKRLAMSLASQVDNWIGRSPPNARRRRLRRRWPDRAGRTCAQKQILHVFGGAKSRAQCSINNLPLSFMSSAGRPSATRAATNRNVFFAGARTHARALPVATASAPPHSAPRVRPPLAE